MSSHEKCCATAPEVRLESERVLSAHLAEVRCLELALLHLLRDLEADERVKAALELHDLVVSERANTFACHEVLLQWTKDISGAEGFLRTALCRVAGCLAELFRRSETKKKAVSQTLREALELMKQALPAFERLHQAALKFDDKHLAAFAKREVGQLQMAIAAFETAGSDTVDRQEMDGLAILEKPLPKRDDVTSSRIPAEIAG